MATANCRGLFTLGTGCGIDAGRARDGADGKSDGPRRARGGADGKLDGPRRARGGADGKLGGPRRARGGAA